MEPITETFSCGGEGGREGREGEGERREGGRERREGGRRGGREGRLKGYRGKVRREGERGKEREGRERRGREKAVNHFVNFTHTSNYPHLFSHSINLRVQKVEITIEMLILESASASHLVWHLSLQLHHQLQHLIVSLAWEQYLATVDLK